ncbi:hypothetical protein NSTC731_02800 [Nostoc sp. DSM 114167]|jgi:hypothetical protein
MVCYLHVSLLLRVNESAELKVQSAELKPLIRDDAYTGYKSSEKFYFTHHLALSTRFGQWVLGSCLLGRSQNGYNLKAYFRSSVSQC